MILLKVKVLRLNSRGLFSMIRVCGLIVLLPAILLVILAGLYLFGVTLIAIGIGNIIVWFIGEKSEKASSQK
jgi:hypothetical protein